MSKEVKVPQISEDADSGTVADIYVKEGDEIEEGQDIIGLESDKASVDVPSDASGKVKSIKVSEGDEVKVGDVILILEDSDGDSSESSESEDEKEKGSKDSDDSDPEKEEDSEDEEDDSEDEDKDSEKEKEESNEDDSEEEEGDDEDSDKDDDSDEEVKSEKKKSSKDASASSASDDEDDEESEKEESKDKSDKKKSKNSKEESADEADSEEDDSDDNGPVAPLAKKFARELGVDISEIQGDDPEKRVTREDVMAHAKKMISAAKKSGGESKASEASGGVLAIELPDFSRWGETEREPLSGIRNAVAKNTTTSWQNIPHVTQHDQADLTELHEFLDKTSNEDGVKLSMTAVLTKITVEALKQFPKFNASLDLENKEIVYKKYYHISIAVDTENGLMMPVMQDVDQKPINKLSEELSELAEKARNQKLKPEEMKGGNFAISNLGGIGGTYFTPVIFPPQAAILGVSSSETRPVWNESEFEPREILPLSLSYDHRLIDGAEAARFLRWICEVIEQPFNLLTR